VVVHPVQILFDIIVQGAAQLKSTLTLMNRLPSVGSRVKSIFDAVGRSTVTLSQGIINLGKNIKITTAQFRAMRRMTFNLLFGLLGLGFAFNTLASVVGTFVRPAIMEFAAMGDETSALTRGITNMQIAVKGLMHEFAAYVAPTIDLVGRKFLEFRSFVSSLSGTLKGFIANALLVAFVLGLILSPLLFLLMPFVQLGVIMLELVGTVGAFVGGIGPAIVIVGAFIVQILFIIGYLAAMILVLHGVWETIKRVFPKGAAAIENFVKVAFNVLNILWTFLVDMFTLGLELLTAIWEGRWGDIFNILGKIAGRIVRLIFDLGAWLIETFSAAFGAILELAAEFGTAIWEAIFDPTKRDDLMERLFGTTKSFLDEFVSGFAEGFAGIDESVTGTTDNLAALEDQLAGLGELGTLTTGFPEGGLPAGIGGVTPTGAAGTPIFINITTIDPGLEVTSSTGEVETTSYNQEI